MGSQISSEGRRKVFLEWKSIELTYELYLVCGGNVNYYKKVHYPIPTCGNRELTGNFQNKSVSPTFNWVSRYILFLAKLKGRGRPFLEGPRRGTTSWDDPQEHLIAIRDEKVSPFVKFEIILALLCFLLDPLINRHCRTWSSDRFLLDRFQDIWKVNNSAVSKAEVSQLLRALKRKCFWGILCCHALV